MQRQLSSAYRSTPQRNHVSALLESTMRDFGYEALELPIMANAELFLTKAGDQLITRLFTFERQGRQLALRPEFTALAAHHYLTEKMAGTVRWQFNGPIFIDDPETASEGYQHLSIGAELIGMSGPQADAEIIAMAARGLMAQALDDWQLVIGHVGLLRQLIACYELDNRTERFLLNHREDLRHPARGKAYLLNKLDQLLGSDAHSSDLVSGPRGADSAEMQKTSQMLGAMLNASRRSETMGGRTQEDIASRLLQKRQRAAERDKIMAALDFLEEWTLVEAGPDAAFSQIDQIVRKITDDKAVQDVLETWRATVKQLADYAIPGVMVVIAPELARSWDYYTGIVFDLRTKNDTQLGGGGRYDELCYLIDGKSHVPAVGFAYYMDALLAGLDKVETS